LQEKPLPKETENEKDSETLVCHWSIKKGNGVMQKKKRQNPIFAPRDEMALYSETKGLVKNPCSVYWSKAFQKGRLGQM